MRKYAVYKLYIIMALGAVLLAGCEQLAPDVKSPQSFSESELLRKNGNQLIENGNPKEAIVIFDKLIALDPQNALAYNGKAVAFDHSGNHLAAQDIYKTALSLSPNSVPIKNNLAMSFILNSQINQAIKLLEPLVKKGTSTGKSISIVRHYLALAYGISGQHEKATKLNLRDMTKEQAQENISFYKIYAARNLKSPKDGIPLKDVKQNKKNIPQEEQNIGFITPPVLSPTVSGKTLPAKTTNPNKSDVSSSPMGTPVVYDYPK